ncbi:unnamed protein product, partial [Didymodactylos carnosus]
MVISTIPRTLCSTATPTNIVYWSLSGDTFSMFNSLYNAQTVNNPVYSSGYSFPIALLLSKAAQQYVIAPSIDVFSSDFTVEAWINLQTVNAAGYMSIMGQCLNPMNCMYIGILNSSVFMSWGGVKSVTGNTSLSTNQWYHIAYNSQQLLYLNGRLDGQGTTTGTTLSTSGGNITIGTTQNQNQNQTYFDGKIGQVLISRRLKTPQEILEDATLVAYYSFGCNADLYFQQDSGPNYMDGAGSGALATTANSIHNNSLLFNLSTSYFQISNLVAFGQANQPLSFLLWLYPSTVTGGTIIHISSYSAGAGFCIPYMGLSSAGNIVVQLWTSNGASSIIGPILPTNSWTHIAQTFSPSNGLRLYVNATLTG